MQNQIEETESTEIMEKSQIKKQSLTYLFFKRLTDIVLSLLALICFSPVFLGVWITNRFGDNKGPLFFKQTRIGKNGKPFKMYKFRSMIVNADEMLHSNIELYEK